MQYFINATDFTDPGALERRIAVRDAHLHGISDLKGRGQILFAAAKTDDAGKMIGSILVAEFTGRGDLDSWLAAEPYVQNKVWDKIEISTCKVPQLFLRG